MQVVAIDLKANRHTIDGVRVTGYPFPQLYGGDADGNVTVPLADGTTRVYPWRQAVEVNDLWSKS